jgi:MoaA/NifB/PqqE/SkfB family radical SAM enzyme
VRRAAQILHFPQREKKLRLLVTDKCNRACEGCCNNDWDIAGLPVAEHYSGYSEILLTGGEPMMNPPKVLEVAHAIREEDHEVPIYMYTAKAVPAFNILGILLSINGITLTLHEQKDAEGFEYLNELLLTVPNRVLTMKQLRLNIFKGVEIYRGLHSFDMRHWVVKDGMEWEKDCPLPKDEVFMRYE